MKEAYGNIWKMSADYVCITTNGFIKSNGEGVMGRGVAKQAADHFPHLPKDLGIHLKRWGNNVGVLDGWLVVFPVKHNWWEKADLQLIRRSAVQLAAFARQNPSKTFLLPRPGCGNGGLTWEDVKQIIEILPDNVFVVTNDLSGKEQLADAQSIINELAGEWNTCPTCHGGREAGTGTELACPVCGGTGRVRRYPLLVKPCTEIHSLAGDNYRTVRTARHDEVGCSGYHPKRAEDLPWSTVVEAAWAADYYCIVTAEYVDLDGTTRYLYEHTGTPESVRLAALCALYAADAQAEKEEE